MQSYQRSANWILYLHDRVQLKYHFAKLGKEGWKSLAHPDPAAEPDPNLRPALAEFYADYDLPEFRLPRMTRLGRADFRRAMQQKRVPKWALNLLDLNELKGG